MGSLTSGSRNFIEIETAGVRLDAGVRAALVERAESLCRGHDQLLGLKLNLRRSETSAALAEYSAMVRLVLPRYEKIVVKRGRQLSMVISQTLEGAGRQLQRRTRVLRTKEEVSLL